MPSNIIYPTEKEQERNRLLVIIEGASAKIVFNLTTGAFLVGLLKYMGASDEVCGYILAIPVLAAIIQVISPIILEGLVYRKKIILIGAMVHRLLLSSIIIILLLPFSTQVKLLLTGIIFLISNLANSFVTPAVSNMYISFVPQSIRGRYFGLRESYLLLSATIVTLILGRVLDSFTAAGNEATGYIVVYAVIFIFTLINNVSFFLMKEVPMAHSNVKIKISEVFSLPLKDKVFTKYFIMLIIYNFGIQIANAFYSVYLKSDLNMNYTIITTFSLISAVVYIFSARLWGRFADKNGWATTTMITIGILGIGHFIWYLAFEGSPLIIFLLVLAHIASGLSWSGINVSLFNLQFDFTPNEKRIVYIGFSAAVSSFIGWIAALIGTQLVGLFGNKKILIGNAIINIKQLLFLASSVLLFICSAYIWIFMMKRPKLKTDCNHKNIENKVL